ncbi:MAG: hypothetical protein IIA58_00225 [Candidatus Marinimicrobia bacterium]|nr:hypothetical protein [Candidatus Neomarinimicrobiota bacterium]
MITRKITFANKILCSIFILTAMSCEESLPPRDEVPVEVFEILFGTVDGRTSYTATRDPANIHSRHPPPIKFTLRLVNIFDETLQDFAHSINGTLDIWLAEDPTVGKTFLLTKDSEVPPIDSPSHINNGLLTLDQSDTFYIEIHWQHEVEDSVKLWDYFEMKSGEERLVEIRALAKIQLFPELPHISTEILKIKVKYIKLS